MALKGFNPIMPKQTGIPASVIRWAPPKTSMELASLVASCVDEEEKKTHRELHSIISEDEDGSRFGSVLLLRA
jgi:hypothetical protein